MVKVNFHKFSGELIKSVSFDPPYAVLLRGDSAVIRMALKILEEVGEPCDYYYASIDWTNAK